MGPGGAPGGAGGPGAGASWTRLPISHPGSWGSKRLGGKTLNSSAGSMAQSPRSFFWGETLPDRTALRSVVLAIPASRAAAFRERATSRVLLRVLLGVRPGPGLRARTWVAGIG